MWLCCLLPCLNMYSASSSFLVHITTVELSQKFWRGQVKVHGVELERAVPCGAPVLFTIVTDTLCCSCTHCGLPVELVCQWSWSDGAECSPSDPCRPRGISAGRWWYPQLPVRAGRQNGGRPEVVWTWVRAGSGLVSPSLRMCEVTVLGTGDPLHFYLKKFSTKLRGTGFVVKTTAGAILQRNIMPSFPSLCTAIKHRKSLNVFTHMGSMFAGYLVRQLAEKLIALVWFVSTKHWIWF